MNFMSTLVVVLGLVFGFGSSIKIDVNKQYGEDGIQKSFNIRCTVEKDENCEKSNMILSVSKEGDTKIASLQGQDRIDYGPLKKPSVKATGRVDDDEVSNCYLSVTIDHMMREDSGVYTCSMFYLDHYGIMHQEKASKNITLGNQNSEDLIRYLLTKVSYLENVVESQQNQGEKQMSGMQKLQKEHQKVVADIGIIKNQSAIVQAYMETPVIAFSYGYAHNTKKISKGITLIFTEKIMDIGNAYDKSNGLFTAPLDGIYVFTLVVMTAEHGGDININLVSGNQVVATLLARDDKYYDQSSVSTVVTLSKGGRVRPVVTHSNIERVHKDNHFSYFTGYLLKPL